MGHSPLTPQQVAQSLALLGLSVQDLQGVRRYASVDEANAKLDELKQRAKKAYRQQVKVLHPDQNGGDADKTEQFKALTAVMADLEALKVAPPPVQMRIVQMGSPFTGTAATSIGGFGFGGFGHVTFVVQTRKL